MTPKKRFIFISGGTRGIGKAVTLNEAGPNSTLFINYLRDDEAAAEVKKLAEKKGAEVHLCQGHVGDPEAIVAMFKDISSKTKHLDALVHCAALGVFKPVHTLRVKDWDISLDVNAKALLLLSQNALPLMKASGGQIVAISSLGSFKFTPNYGAIGISKAAMENLVRYLAVELSEFHIRVNAVSGGLVDTESLKMFPDFDQMKKEFLARTPGRRIGTAQDIADVVSFLLSEKSAWIFGQTLIADGGYSLA